MPKSKEKRVVCVKVYFTEAEFTDVVAEAEKAGIRHMGLKLKVLKPHGFAGQYLWNTKRIARFLKKCVENWKGTAADRAVKLAQLEAEEKRIRDEKAKLGVSFITHS